MHRALLLKKSTVEATKVFGCSTKLGRLKRQRKKIVGQMGCRAVRSLRFHAESVKSLAKNDRRSSVGHVWPPGAARASPNCTIGDDKSRCIEAPSN